MNHTHTHIPKPIKRLDSDAAAAREQSLYLLFLSGHTLSVPALLLLFQLHVHFLHLLVHFFFLPL